MFSKMLGLLSTLLIAAILQSFLQLIDSADVVTWSLKASELYTKVPTNYLNLGPCHLGGKTMNKASKIECAAFCNQTPGCFLFCLKGTSCDVYSAMASDYYLASDPSIFDSCHSSWQQGKDVAHLGSVSSSSAESANRISDFAINGFFCRELDFFCFTTNPTTQPWFQVDLGDSYDISRIKIITVRHTTAPFFKNVEARVGDSATVGSNPIFDTFGGDATWGDIIEFIPAQVKTGRYVFLKSLESNVRLGICDIQIVTA